MRIKIKGLDSNLTLDEIYDQFLKENKDYCSIDGHCEQCTDLLVDAFNAEGYGTRKVRGEFKVDNPVHLPLQLHHLFPRERKEFLETYRGKIKKEDLSKTILAYAKKNNFDDELFYIEHTWVEVDDIIFDPSIYIFMKATEKEITEDNYKLRERG